MDEIIFIVEEAPEGGYSARALGVSIFAEADDLEALETELRDAVVCHYEDEAKRPRMIRLSGWPWYISGSADALDTA